LRPQVLAMFKAQRKAYYLFEHVLQQQQQQQQQQHHHQQQRRYD
jgi:hypothetical protein